MLLELDWFLPFEAVQHLAEQILCPKFINSYWATEHGAIAWSRISRLCDVQEIHTEGASTNSWPLPWVCGDVLVFEEAEKSNEQQLWRARVAQESELGEVVVNRPFPSMFRLVWGSAESLGQESWCGDRELMLARYWRKTLVDDAESWVYVQGDFAAKESNDAYTFHGRSDEGMNVN
eukprot:29933-Amphidinium_carterae.1